MSFFHLMAVSLFISIHSTGGASEVRVALISAQDTWWGKISSKSISYLQGVCLLESPGRSFGQTFCKQPMFDTCGCSHVKPSLGNILQCSVEPIEGHCLGWYPLNTSGIPTAGILRCGSFRKSAKTSFLPSQFWQKQASSLSTPTVIVSCHVMFRAVGCWFAGRGRIDFPLRCTTKKTILTITPQDRFWKVNFDPN